jgi:hypothetical protein
MLDPGPFACPNHIVDDPAEKREPIARSQVFQINAAIFFADSAIVEPVVVAADDPESPGLF